MANIKHLECHSRFRFTKAGKHSYLDMTRGILESDVVFHLASPVGVARVVKNPRECLRSMTSLSQEVFSIAAYGHKKVFYASSSEAIEDGPSENPRSAYGIGKRYCEALAFSYGDDFPITIGRFYNIAGPRQNLLFVLPIFILQALDSHPMTIYGDGQQRRSFCHVRDAVEAILALSESPEATGKVCDIGRRDSVTLLELAEQVKAVTGGDSEIAFIPYPFGEEVSRRMPNLKKIEAFCGWKPKRGLVEIIQDTVEVMRG